MSKIKKKADAKKIADSIAKAKEKFPDLCKEGQKIQVAEEENKEANAKLFKNIVDLANTQIERTSDFRGFNDAVR